MSAKDKKLTSANLIFFFPPVILTRDKWIKIQSFWIHLRYFFSFYHLSKLNGIPGCERFKPCYMLSPVKKNFKPEKITAAVALKLPAAVALKLSDAIGLKLPFVVVLKLPAAVALKLPPYYVLYIEPPPPPNSFCRLVKVHVQLSFILTICILKFIYST